MINQKKSPDGDIVEDDSIDDFWNPPKYRTISEENRKNKHQTFQQKVALILVLAYSLLEIGLLIYGSKGVDTSFFERHIESFRLLVGVVIGYYFGSRNG